MDNIVYYMAACPLCFCPLGNLNWSSMSLPYYCRALAMPCSVKYFSGRTDALLQCHPLNNSAGQWWSTSASCSCTVALLAGLHAVGMPAPHVGFFLFRSCTVRGFNSKSHVLHFVLFEFASFWQLRTVYCLIKNRAGKKNRKKKTRFVASEGQGWDEFMALPKRFS